MKSIMEMHQIKYFLAVCSERTFSRAAKLCQVSQPSLTRAIKLLEAEFGGSLFRRTRGHSHLTALGEIVRPHLEKVWEKHEAAITMARESIPPRGNCWMYRRPQPRASQYAM